MTRSITRAVTKGLLLSAACIFASTILCLSIATETETVTETVTVTERFQISKERFAEHSQQRQQRQRRRRRLQDESLLPINVLSLGGSVTWGSALERRDQSFPSLLALDPTIQRSDNLAVRASSAVWPSTCVQSMIRDASSGQDVEYSVILLEFSLNGIMGLQLLVHRLRRRYPRALIIYIDLYSNRKPGWSNCIGPTCRVTAPRHAALLELIQAKMGGHVLDLPRPQDPLQYETSEVSHWFAPDQHHLNQNGHAWIAQQVMHLIQTHYNPSPASSSSASGTGSWLEGDLCLSWFHTGRVPQGLSVEGASLHEFAPSKWAYEVSSHAMLDLMLQQEHDDAAVLSGPAPLIMVYMTKQDLYPRVEVTLNGMPPLEFDSTSSNERFFEDHVTEAKALGTIHPTQDAVVHLEIVNLQPGRQLLPFRLVGLTMCAACKTFDSKFEGKQCRQRACVDWIEEQQ